MSERVHVTVMCVRADKMRGREPFLKNFLGVLESPEKVWGQKKREKRNEYF